jgi:hypothetical protein
VLHDAHADLVVDLRVERLQRLHLGLAELPALEALEHDERIERSLHAARELCELRIGRTPFLPSAANGLCTSGFFGSACCR